MAILTVSIKRTQTAEAKTGAISIKVKSTGNVLSSGKMRELAMKRIPMNLSFDVDSDQMRNRAVFNL